MTEKELWRLQVKFWSTAVTFISFLSACFILNSLERERIWREAQRSILVPNGLPTDDPIQINKVFPSAHPNWDPNSDGVIQNNSIYWKIGKKLSNLKEFQKFPNITCEKEEENWSCCPTFWRPFGSSCYFISTTTQSWTESQKNCSMMEAELTVINTKEDQNFIIQHLNKDFAYYIGLTDPEGHRHWQWVDQTPYNKNATFWHAGEPNDPNERCVVVNFRSKTEKWGWNDIHCDLPQKAICKTMKIYL